MSDTPTIGFPEAAQRLGVSIGVLRRAIRAGKIPTPAGVTATTALSPEWLAGVEASSAAVRGTVRQKVPAFARYEGTSAWRKYRRRVREYARFQSKG